MTFNDSTIETHPLPTSRRFIDLTGQRFGRLTVQRFAGRPKPTRTMWECLCDCGTIRIAERSNLKKGSVQSCGCLSREMTIARSTKHGDASGGKCTVEWTSYRNARARCHNLKHKSYPDYGGRGIEFRFESFEEFLATVGRKPTPDHSLDRIDVDGHYERGNVRWATPTEQGRNKRTNVFISAHGKTMTRSEWANILGVSPECLSVRHKAGWCDECTVTLPVDNSRTGQGCPHR